MTKHYSLGTRPLHVQRLYKHKLTPARKITALKLHEAIVYSTFLIKVSLFATLLHDKSIISHTDQLIT